MSCHISEDDENSNESINTATSKTPARRKAFIQSDSSDENGGENEAKSSKHEDYRTPKQQHSTPIVQSAGSRSSSRLQSKQQREFRMPDRKAVFDQIESVQDNISLSLSDFKPRKLVNNFMKTTNRYNYDPAYTSGESSGMEDFLDDNFEYVDESSYLSEDSNISSDPERSQIKTEEKKKRKKTKRQRKPSKKADKETSKPRRRSINEDTENLRQSKHKRTKDVNANENKRSTRRHSDSKPVIKESDSDETSDYSQYSCDENADNVNTKKLHNISRVNRTIHSDTENESDVPLSKLRAKSAPKAGTSQQNDFSCDSDIPLSMLKNSFTPKPSTSQQQDHLSSESETSRHESRKRKVSRFHSSSEDSGSDTKKNNDVQNGTDSESQKTNSHDSDLGELSKSILEKVNERSKAMADKKSERKHSFDELRKKRLRRLSRS